MDMLVEERCLFRKYHIGNITFQKHAAYCKAAAAHSIPRYNGYCLDWVGRDNQDDISSPYS